MLQDLQIKNFKGWRDTGKIRMAPLTLFFGANSSGKSSIGQFLMMLKQTVEYPDRKAVFYPGGINSAVQLGSYREMVFHRDPSTKIGFEYSWTIDDPLKIVDPINDKVFSGDTLSFNAQVGLVDKELHSLAVDNFKYKLYSNKIKFDEILSVSMTRRTESLSKFKINANKYSLKRNTGRVWDPGAPVRFYGFPDEVMAYHQNAEFVQSLNLIHEKLFHSIFYLGPLRTMAERLYSWSGMKPVSAGYAGENTIPAILAALRRNFNFGSKKALKPFDKIIVNELQKMNLIEDFKINRISEDRQEYEVKIRAKGSLDSVDLPDVGFGISQVLPVLVQCFYAPPGSIIIMEQPEIHLHPAAQADLADVMIDVINSRENGVNRNIQLVIETHSEHFLRRLQRRIAEERISEDDVSAYFADAAQTPAKLEPLEVDLFGNIHNWPKNFFGDEMGDITAHAEAALKKRLKQLESKA